MPALHSLAELPPEVLEKICTQLPAQDPIRALPLVCRKFRDFTRQSHELWRTCALNIEATEQHRWKEKLRGFVKWLAARAAGVRRLSLRLELPEAAAVRKAAWDLVGTALAAVAPTLKELELVWPGMLEVSEWLALPQLTGAELTARVLVFTAGAGAARNLQSLSLYLPSRGPGLTFPAAGGCLPPALEALDLRCGLTRLPLPQLAGLSCLRQLDLSCNPRMPEPDLATALGSLSGLQQLDLNHAWLPAIPHHLSLLHDLRVLYLHECLADPPASAAEMHAQFQAALGPLRRLAMLSISGNALPELPSAVAACTTLRALHTEGNQMALAPGPYLAALEELALDWNTLFTSHTLLRAAPRLSRLLACGSHSLGEDGAAAATPAAVAASLAACGHLSHFVDVLPEGSGEALDLEVAQLMYLLPRACPRLAVSATASECYGYSLNSLPMAWRGD